MKKTSAHHNEEIKRFNRSINEGLDNTAIEYMKSVGKGIAYPWMVGNAKASASGMSNSSDTRASFFGVY